MGWILHLDILVHTIMLLRSRGSNMGFLDPSVVYSFFPLDDLFILIGGVVLVVFKEAQRGILYIYEFYDWTGALSLLSCSCCRHELDLVDHATLPLLMHLCLSLLLQLLALDLFIYVFASFMLVSTRIIEHDLTI